MAFEAHEKRFFRKSNRMSNPPSEQPELPPSPNTLDGLVALDLVTETPTVSISIKVGGVKSAHIILSDVADWDLQVNKLIVFSNEPEPLSLTFINVTEAQLGLDRFETAMNGGTI